MKRFNIIIFILVVVCLAANIFKAEAKTALLTEDKGEDLIIFDSPKQSETSDLKIFDQKTNPKLKGFGGGGDQDDFNDGGGASENYDGYNDSNKLPIGDGFSFLIISGIIYSFAGKKFGRLFKKSPESKRGHTINNN